MEDLSYFSNLNPPDLAALISMGKQSEPASCVASEGHRGEEACSVDNS